MEVQLYKTAVGKEPLTEWLDNLRDGTTRARIAARLDRLKSGLLGDWKTVGDGVTRIAHRHRPRIPRLFWAGKRCVHPAPVRG